MIDRAENEQVALLPLLRTMRLFTRGRKGYTPCKQICGRRFVHLMYNARHRGSTIWCFYGMRLAKVEAHHVVGWGSSLEVFLLYLTQQTI